MPELKTDQVDQLISILGNTCNKLHTNNMVGWGIGVVEATATLLAYWHSGSVLTLFCPGSWNVGYLVAVKSFPYVFKKNNEE